MVKTQNIDSDRLVSAIEKSGLKLQYIADQIGVSRQALHRKVYGENAFRQSEVYVLCHLLNIADTEKAEIFFPEMLGDDQTAEGNT